MHSRYRSSDNMLFWQTNLQIFNIDLQINEEKKHLTPEGRDLICKILYGMNTAAWLAGDKHQNNLKYYFNIRSTKRVLYIQYKPNLNIKDKQCKDIIFF